MVLRLVTVVLAVNPMILWADDLFPPVSPGGYMPNGQAPNGYNPVPGGYQYSVVPSQPMTPSRPDGFAGGPTPPMATNGGNPAGAAAPAAAPPYGPTYARGQQPIPGNTLQASYVGQPPLQGGAMSGMPPAPARLCGGAQIIGRVGNDVVLTSDVLLGIDDLMANAKGKIPPEKFAEQRAMLVQEATAGIDAFNAHYLDPDPVKAMTLSQRGLIIQLLRQQIDVKMIYQDFRKKAPKEALPSIQENINRHFDETQLSVLMKRENVVSRADLENALRAKGSSLERERRIFTEKVVSQQWAQEQLKPAGKEGTAGNSEDAEVTHEEMLAWYNAHLKEFEQPAKARWEELMISFTRHPAPGEAYATVAAMGNRVLAGASLADVAKSASEGPTARQGGQRDWTHKDSLSSENLNQAIFSLPVGQLSPILESENGCHIVRVVERRELTRTSFVDAQKQIKESIKEERFKKRYKEWVDKLHATYPIWTVFDNSLQEQNKPDDDDNRYSTK